MAISTEVILSYVMPFFKIGGMVFLALIGLAIAYWYFFIHKRRRKWIVEVHEIKADGKLHTVGKDMLIEMKKKMGTITYYWMKKARTECIPPPSEVVDRFGGKEEVDYLRIEREFVPADKKVVFNYNDPKIKARIVPIYDAILEKIHSIKSTYLHSEAVRDRWIYIPVQKTLVAKVEFSPIPYDMNMMAVNEITNADAHFASQYEFWKKYGAVIVFAMTVIFLLIMAVLTYDHLEKISAVISGKLDATNNILQGLVDKMAGAGKPPA